MITPMKSFALMNLSEMVENTKEYICRALVTLVDHLGNVSSKLDRLISIPNHFSDVELRIHCLQQRIMSSQQHVQKLAMYKLRWRENLPIYQTCYLPTVTLTDAENSKGDPRREIYSSNKYIRSGKIPNFVHASTSVDEPSPYSKIVFSREMAMHKELSSSLPTKAPNPTFPFQLVPSKLDRSRSLNRRSSSPTLLGSDILSLIRHRVRKGNAKS
ncbi:PREDICTED: probable protein ABIL5 isoform X2 [Tarenaya hassleriana]|uniref:probable protein ABIL5 isoform X2 n=1 Tax=Tarenaya hassleriana TaxID=28532 RepID=UPI00053C1C0A|nr:PREDICTED: probable protein ABIL5 isoform X2 [Tarenaya hassleriana]